MVDDKAVKGMSSQPVSSAKAVTELIDQFRQAETGRRLVDLIAELFPLCRSLTGNGVRQTLQILRRSIPLKVHEVPTGTKVYDWTVPQEWNINDAYIKNSRGERVVDFRESNLHVMGYSVPVHTKMSLQELLPRLYSLPERPDWVPVRMSYYMPNWGFSIAHNRLATLDDGEYEVCIDSRLEDGHLTYGELYLPGELQDEVLISTHICHPSLANDNLSGIAVATLLAQLLGDCSRRYSYRFLFIPAQLGSLAWLAAHEEVVPLIKHGMVLVALGYPSGMTYKKSRRGNAEIDRAAAHCLAHSGQKCQIVDFLPHGNDERQYCSPGFNLPVGSLMRTPCGQFPEYHTSADNLSCVKPDALADSLLQCLNICAILEGNARFLNTNPKGEPQLGRRGLYRMTSDLKGAGKVRELPILWVLNLSDGEHSLLDIAERSGYRFAEIRQAADALFACGLLREVSS